MKIALCQMDLAWLDVPSNLNKIEKYLNDAEAQGVDLLVFPEMALTGFCMDSTAACTEINGPVIRQLADLTRGKRLLTLVGAAVRRKQRLTNECLLLRNGELVGSYAKMNLFTPTGEHQHYHAGERMLAFDFEGHRFTPLVCFDSRFVQPIITAAASGTDAFIVIASWPAAQSSQWKTLLSARAIDTQAFVIGVNRIGSGGGMDFRGECMVFSPSGKPMFEFSSDERLIVLDVDFTYSRKLKQRFPVFAEQYQRNHHAAIDHVTIRG